MDFVNPPYVFVLMDGILGPRLFGASYRRYAETIELRGDEDVLEFGCGSGGVAERLAPRLPKGSLTCVDISPPMVEIAARRLKKYSNARCLVGRIENLALPESGFDLVVIHNALHDVAETERRATAATLVRLLKPGGRLHLREPTKLPHGLASDAYRALLVEAGLSEVRSHDDKSFLIGRAFDAVFARPD